LFGTEIETQKDRETDEESLRVRTRGRYREIEYDRKGGMER
jgi:hypothetical protein